MAGGLPRSALGNLVAMQFLLWAIAAVLVVSGAVTLGRGAAATGVVLILVGLLDGLGGASLFA